MILDPQKKKNIYIYMYIYISIYCLKISYETQLLEVPAVHVAHVESQELHTLLLT